MAESAGSAADRPPSCKSRRVVYMHSDEYVLYCDELPRVKLRVSGTRHTLEFCQGCPLANSENVFFFDVILLLIIHVE